MEADSPDEQQINFWLKHWIRAGLATAYRNVDEICLIDVGVSEIIPPVASPRNNIWVRP